MVGFHQAIDWATCIAISQGNANGNEGLGWSKAVTDGARLVIVGCAGADDHSAALRIGHTTGRLRFSIYSPHFRLGSLTSLPKPVLEQFLAECKRIQGRLPLRHGTRCAPRLGNKET